MLNITEFDVKTGVAFQEFGPATQTLQPKQKQVEHSFLEQVVLYREGRRKERKR